MRRSLLALLATISLWSTHAIALQQFQSEAAAQAHCPSDIVVWLNLPTMIYHYKGQRWYGRTKHGTYVCKQEADAEGARATRNGE